jgi:hypothetical protein
MSTTLYNNACAPAQTNTATDETSHLRCDANVAVPAYLDIIEGNRLHLLSDHSVIVYSRCLDQLALCQLSPRCSRVFCIILNQTIGRSKLEDNMTTTRLEQLTKICHDHAGQAMKDLAAMNIIIHRAGGKYRNYLSINFNFSMWGNLTIAAQHKNNNPAILLPKKYTETPIDNGLLLDPAKLQHTAHPSTVSSLNNPLEQTETPACSHAIDANTKENAKVIKVENSTIQSAKNKAINTHNTQEVQKLETKLTALFSKKLSSALETINQTLQGFEKHLSTAISIPSPELTVKETAPLAEQKTEKLATDITVNSEKNTATKTASIKPQIELRQAQNQYNQNSPYNNPQNDSQYNNQSPESVQNPQQKSHQEEKAVVVASSDYSIEIAPFNYPEKLDTEQCQALQGLLVKSGSRAQDLLNLLAQRLNNTRNPVHDPASYFASLVYKYRKNQLDFSALSAIKPFESTKDKAQKEYFKELKFQHRSCHNDYLHFQRIVENEMKKSQQSFKEVCENSPLGGIIEDCSNKLLKAKRALDDFLAGDKAIPA